VTVRIGSSFSAPGLPLRRPGRTTSPVQRTRVHRRRGMPRVVDLVLGGAALLVLAPLMAGVALLVKCTSRGSVLFAQTRLGQDGKPFRMLKFRTMFTDCDDRLHREYVQKLLTTPAASLRSPAGLYKLVDDPRITRLGRWLRRSSLDELPQLINVLRGEMSLVGPRPALPWEAAMYDPRYARRFDVRPGITGLWQISGRNRLTATQALDLDVEYVERRSFRLDLAILCRTIPTVLSRDGAG
jgi:lipopolysaccharide/colanic/teichoic acid biosynthesis glycosyltransferase